ncbi:MAG TPA: glutaredoxin [bacterium]|nr:glutaredoxin [bacterium]
MALLKATDAEAIRRRFQAELADDVTIRLFTASAAGLAVPGWDCEFCPATQQLLEEVAALDPRLRLEIHSITTELEPGRGPAVERVPAIVIDAGAGAGIRFYGIPSGFEFAALIDALLAVSRHDSGLAPETKAALATLAVDVHLQVFVMPTCPYCPRASRLAHAMAGRAVRRLRWFPRLSSTRREASKERSPRPYFSSTSWRPRQSARIDRQFR